MNYGREDDLAAWARSDLLFGNQNVVIGVPSRAVGRAILDRIADGGIPHIRRRTAGSLETIDGAKVYYAASGDQVHGIQAKVYMHCDAPIELDRALAPCEIDYA